MSVAANAKPRSVALVTGGASGIGRACAELLAQRGWHVAVADLHREACEDVAARIGGSAHVLDVRSEDEVRACVGECHHRFGAIDGLVASAGILQRPEMPEDFGMASFDEVMNVNFRGAYLTAREAGVRMARQGSGSIVFIGSVTAVRATPLHAYGPLKAAILHLTQGLAAEWGRSGVRVNAVSPGYVSTPALEKQVALGLRDPHVLASAAACGRLVQPLEIAKAVAFLLGEESSAVTGVNLPVDAGWLVASHAATYGGVRPPRTTGETT